MAAGVMHVLEDYVQAQSSEGYQVEVLFVARPETPVDVKERFSRAGSVREFKGPSLLALWKAAAAAEGRLRNDPRTIVHAHSTRAGLIVRLRAIAFGWTHRVAYAPHGFGFLRLDLSPGTRWLLTLMERALARGCRRVVLVSPSEAEVASRILPKEKCVVVPNSVNQDAFAGLASRTGPERAVVVTVGRIGPQKAPQRFASLARDCADVADFVWVGDGEYRFQKELEAAGVEVTGWLSKEEVRERMRSASVFTLLSRWEGMPLALLEAQAEGLPAVATDVVGNKDIVVDGQTGFLVSTGAEARRALLRLLHDRDLAKAFSEAAVERSRQFGLTTTLDCLNALYASYETPTEHS